MELGWPKQKPRRRQGSSGIDKEQTGRTDENKTVGDDGWSWSAHGCGTGVGAPRVCRGIRPEKTAYLEGNGDQVGSHQSTLLDSHVREGRRRTGGHLDDRRR